MGTSYQFNPKTGLYERKDSDSVTLTLPKINLNFSDSTKRFGRFGILALLAASAYGLVSTKSSSLAEYPVAPTIVDKNSLTTPQYGQITLGAFAAEAANMVGISSQSTAQFADPETYKKYRDAVKEVYGADLYDMNYFGLGLPNSQERIRKMGQWLLLAGQYGGNVTIALEPLGPEKMNIFADNSEMQELRKAFLAAKNQNVVVWVRFASESNLGGSEYSASKSLDAAVDFYNRAVWFKNYMPDNVKLVYSPLINTAASNSPWQQKIITYTFNGGSTDNTLPWDRVGGTLYRTNVELAPTYEKYYDRMIKLAPHLEYQLCELGGPYWRKEETSSFIQDASKGKWPNLVKINLFARKINSRADSKGEFGFVDPVDRDAAIEQSKSDSNYPETNKIPESFIKDLF